MTNKSLFYALMYEAAPKRLARIDGWRRVKVTLKKIAVASIAKSEEEWGLS